MFSLSHTVDSVDGQNLALVDRRFIPLLTGFPPTGQVGPGKKVDNLFDAFGGERSFTPF